MSKNEIEPIIFNKDLFMFILALSKTNQKASASFLGDPKPPRWLNQINGLSPHLILRHLYRIGYPACGTNAQMLTH
ncbi:hypothetical protein IR083_16565 [Dysgonomonas sp. GY75]|nr:hypothetical protein [Dysgonomonas sp. GY75]